MVLDVRIAHPYLVAMALITCSAIVAQCSNPASPLADKSRDNLMVVVRETIGANKQDELLKPTGKLKATLPDGSEIETEMASWEFIGDTHIRFVFDAPQMMLVATPQDLAALSLNTVEDALATAVTNVKRIYGEPVARPWTGGVMYVKGKSPDFDSTYFLDREFWRKLLKEHPEGVVVAVPQRGELLYTPIGNSTAVESLKKSIVRLHASDERMRVSSALYLFKDDRWSVFQAAVRQ